MTKKLFSFALSLFVIVLAIACGTEQKNWKEMDNFHMVMAETFHPYKDSANLEPAKSRASELAAAAEEWAPRELAKLRPELVLLNPPRIGCHSTVSDTIRESGARRAVYVSCEPATLARDLARIGARFRIARLVLLDALPQTHHVELVAALESD